MAGKLNGKTIGIISVIAAAMMWAIEPVVARLAYRTSGFLETTTMRAIITTILAFIHLTGTGKLKSLHIEKSHIPKLAFLGIAGTAIADLLYFYSFTKIPVLNSVLIGHMQPIFVILLGFLIFREENLTRMDLLFIITMLTASLLITTRNPQNFKVLKFGTYGDLLVLISTIIWALSGIIAKKYLTGLTTGAVVFYRFLTASIVLTALSLKFGNLQFNNIYQLINGVIVFVGYTLYYEGLKRLKTAITSSFELTSPLFASLFGYIFFKESITAMQTIGLAMILIAILMARHTE